MGMEGTQASVESREGRIAFRCYAFSLENFTSEVGVEMSICYKIICQKYSSSAKSRICHFKWLFSINLCEFLIHI
jgi:hypothetical protein